MTKQAETPEAEKVEEKVKTFTEQIEVAGNQLVEKVQELVKSGNARRLIIRNQDNEVLMDINLTVGVVGGAVAALAAWWIAPIAVIAAMVARVKVEIVREEVS